MLRALTIFVFACVAACASSSDQPPATPEANAATAAPERAIIATLQTREQMLRIYDGGTFDLLAADGAVIAEGLSEAQLQEEYPEAYATYRTAIADGVVPVMADVDPSATAP